MKKKVLLLLLIPLLLLSVTACGKTDKNVEKVDKRKSVILEDDNKGYWTSIKYNDDENYTNIKENEDGSNPEITFENQDLDIEFQMYYNTVPKVSYEDGKNNRSGQKYFKEYKINKYEAYAYSEYSSGLYLVIKLDDSDEKNTVLLFVSMNRIDNNEDVVVNDVFNDKLKEFFSRIDFKKTK